MDYSLEQSDFDIHPNAYECGTKTTWGWGLEDFLPKSGKTVGVWPVDYSVQSLTTLRGHWGYIGILIGPDQNQYDNAITASYSADDIMIAITGVPDANRYNVINNFGDVFAYFVDEPADQNHSMGQVRNSLNSLGFSSLFIISGYKRTYGLNVCVEQADKVMYSAYVNWWLCIPGVPGVWCSWPVDDDQRPAWTDMQDRYGSKFSLTWINSTEISEFDYLFGHAQNLGLNGVWIFTLDGHSTDQFENISYAAFSHGFLRQRQRQYRIEWRCHYQNPCVNCDPTLPDGWYIDEVFPTAYYRIIEN